MTKLLLDTNIVFYFIYNSDWKDRYIQILRGKTSFIAFYDVGGDVGKRTAPTVE
ncbi:MAG: hypothetical protein LBI05_08710 [Planctomycetaceae bacterium]|jgi:hypothetical protein|nr:hypothetical protein [Planctomycetaceae bacterium]